MKEFLNRLADKPKGQLIGMAVGSVALILLIYWFMFFKSVSEEGGQLKNDIEELKMQIHEEKAVARNLSRYTKEVETLDKRLELVLLELPDKKEIEGFLESISVLATSNGLEVIKFSPRSTQLKEFYAAVPADIELQGTYHQLATFFDEVGHLSRIMNIKDISASIVSERNREVIIRALCKTVAFRYLDEREQALVSKRKKRKRKRK